MTLIGIRTRFGYVEGLGDEEVPWWIAPYVRDVVALAKSAALLEAIARPAEASATGSALAELRARIAQTAAIARVAAHTENGKPLAAGASASLRADIDEYCGTPPRPHHLSQAALAVATFAASMRAEDPAKGMLVSEAERLQQKMGGAR